MMAAASTLALIAAGLSAAGAIAQGQAASQQAKFQASVATQQATRDREIAAAEEEDFRRRQSQIFAQRRAALGASGVEISTGTPLLAAEDFAAEVEFQARRIRAGGEAQATRAEQEASLLRKAGRSARTRGLVRAGASLLSGFSEFSDLRRPRVRDEELAF